MRTSRLSKYKVYQLAGLGMDAIPSPLDEYTTADANVLFNDSVLRRMDCTRCSFTAHGISYSNPGAGLIARPLERGDFDKGYLGLLSQLTKVGDYSREKFEYQFDGMKQMVGCHYIVVVEDPACNKVIASASLVVERKFIHGAALRGRIEDIVVDKDYRNLRLGSLLVELLTVLSKEVGCYKTTLDCKADMVGFYKKFGYVSEGQLFMSMRFYD